MKVIFTAALIEDYKEQRRVEYVESFNTLSNYVGSENINIVEGYLNSKGSYLDDLTHNVYYTTPTTKHLSNKGVKEAAAMIGALDYYFIEEDEFVIKHTGRYKFLSNRFIKDIESNMQVDAFVREGVDSQYFTGTFAMKYKYYKDFLLQLNLPKMESDMISLERELYNYLHRFNITTKVYTHINVYSNIANTDIVIW